MEIEDYEYATKVIRYKQDLQFFRERLEKIIIEGDKPSIKVTIETQFEGAGSSSTIVASGQMLKTPYDGCALKKEHRERLLATLDEIIAEQDKLFAEIGKPNSVKIIEEYPSNNNDNGEQPEN